MSYADMHTHSEEQVNEIDLRVCLHRRLATKTRWSSASSVFSVLLTWFADFIAALLPAKK